MTKPSPLTDHDSGDRPYQAIRRLVGEVQPGDLAMVESHITDRLALFLPLGGACGYAALPMHSHPGWMFTLSYDGKTSISLNDETLTPAAGSLFALAPGTSHTELPTDEPPNYLAIFVDPELVEKVAGAMTPAPALPSSNQVAPALNRLSAVARQLIVELDGEEPGYELVVEGLVNQLVTLILRSLTSDAPGRSEGLAPFDLDRLIGYISRNLSHPIAVADLAREAGYSPPQFGRIFRSATGKSPSAFVAQIRLTAARRMLLDSPKSLTEIAHACGYSSAAHFSSRFSRRYGETPATYRKRLGG